MWFKRLEDNQSTPTNHNISNVLFAQSSAATNDNLEIGTAGSEVHVYLDNGPDQSFVTSLVCHQWNMAPLGICLWKWG